MTADFTFDGYDSFEVTIRDGNGGTDTGTVVIECWGDGEALKASGTSPGVAAALPSDSLAAIVAEARARWQATGVDTSVLDSVEFRMADLSGTQLARVVSSVVLIDSNAAGFGWFVDSTPADDREFLQVSSRRSAAADGQMDLLTAIMHEMGHLLEQQHTESGLMASTLAAGVRKLPVDSAWMAMTVDEFYSSDEVLEDAFLAAD